MNKKIEEYLQKVILESFGISLPEISLSQPPKKSLGDFAFGVFVLSKELKKSPIEIAVKLLEAIKSDTEQNFIDREKTSVEGPYLNIFLLGGSFFDDFVTLQKSLGSDRKDERIIVDYIGANVGKPLHIGHMCTPNIGQVFINAHDSLGYDVIGDSHIGDWGIIFGKLITAFKKYGDISLLETDAVEHLFNLYVKISTEAEKDTTLDQEFRDAFKKLSQGNSEYIDLWKEFTKYSISSMNHLLSRLNVKPDYDIGESFYEGIGLPKMGDYPDLEDSMSEIVRELIKKGIATRNEDGSVGVVFEDSLKIPSCILQKRDGTHGYLASDLATIKYRMQNWAPEKIIYSVDVRQKLHLTQVFIISDLAGWTFREGKEKTQLIHAYNGFISLKDGAMSTRKGKIIKLGALLDEAEKRAESIILEKRNDIQGKELQKLSQTVGIGAIKYGYLKKSRETDVVFDWDEFMTFEGNSGPYIQYAYVRARKILEKQDFSGDISSEGVNFSSDFVALMTEIMKFRSIIEKSMETYHPHIICQYAYSLAKLFNAFYNNESILNETEQNYKNTKIYLVSEFASTLKKSFGVLGIDLPDQM